MHTCHITKHTFHWDYTLAEVSNSYLIKVQRHDSWVGWSSIAFLMLAGGQWVQMGVLLWATLCRKATSNLSSFLSLHQLKLNTSCPGIFSARTVLISSASPSCNCLKSSVKAMSSHWDCAVLAHWPLCRSAGQAKAYCHNFWSAAFCSDSFLSLSLEMGWICLGVCR